VTVAVESGESLVAEGADTRHLAVVQFGPLERLERALQLLAEARDVDEVVHIRGIAEAARVYARQARLGLEAQNYAAEIRLRAERRAGELLSEIPRQRGFAHSAQAEPNVETPYQQTLGRAQISLPTAKRWQQIALVPEPVFERHVAETNAHGRELTAASVAKVAREFARAPRPSSPPPSIPLVRPSRARLLITDVCDGLRSLPRASVHAIVTSPPYYGLRDYKLPATVWGGDPAHEHAWHDSGYVGWNPGGRGDRSVETSNLPYPSAAKRQGEKRPPPANGFGAFCACGAWRGHLGLEITPD
jgi:hypothetical protein